MSFKEKYFRKNVGKRFIKEEFDVIGALLISEHFYQKYSSDYRDFLYGGNSFSTENEGFLGDFFHLKKSVIDKSKNLLDRIDDGQYHSEEEIIKSIRGLSRREFWKQKKYLADHSKNVGYYNDDEEIVQFDPEEDIELHVHHLNPLKTFVNDELSLSVILRYSDPKNHIAMTPKAHLEGKNLGHGGNTKAELSEVDPYEESLASIPNDYYMVLKEKREELITNNINTESSIIGGVSFLLLSAVILIKKENNLLDQLNHRRIVIGLRTISFGSVAILSRDQSRDYLLDSQLLQSKLFKFRDATLTNTSLNDQIVARLGDIDLISDSLSLGVLGAVVQSGKLIEDGYFNGFNSTMLKGHGTQISKKVVIFGGGKYVLSIFMDPTGASVGIVLIYGSFQLYEAHRRKNTNILIEDIERGRTQYYIRREIERLRLSPAEDITENESTVTIEFNTTINGVEYIISETDSNCGKYQYLKKVTWDANKKEIMFIALHPNLIANISDDEALMKFIDIGKSLNYGSITVGYLFAYKCSKFGSIQNEITPIGPLNDTFLYNTAQEAYKVVATWGNKGVYKNRSQKIRDLIPELHYFKLNVTHEPSNILTGIKDLRLKEL